VVLLGGGRIVRYAMPPACSSDRRWGEAALTEKPVKNVAVSEQKEGFMGGE